jgi:S1-C subfamily serine protease
MTDPTRDPDPQPGTVPQYAPPTPTYAATGAQYSPTPEPRPSWASADPSVGWSAPSATTTQPTSTTPTQPVVSRRTGPAVGTVLATSLISAVLASGGTFLALNAAGVLDRPAATTTPTGVETAAPAATQPVTIDESSAVIDVAAKVGPAVVKISTGSNGDPTDPLSIPETGVGSGVIYDANGWILTNRHVVADSDELTVELADGRELSGRIYGIDTLTDLAIVKVDATGLPTASVGDSDALEVGQLTIAIGSPLGTYSNTVTSGILSARGRSIQVEGGSLNNLLQTDTAINPGNSGGPLLDAAGNIIGINTAVATSAEGIGFAIPINIARPIMEQAVAGEKIARPYIGVRFQTIDVQMAEERDLPVSDGALINDGPGGQSQPGIVPDGPADEAGLESGDIVTAIEGVELDGDHPLDAVVSQFAPGDTITLDILRDGTERSIDITLGTRPADL